MKFMHAVKLSILILIYFDHSIQFNLWTEIWIHAMLLRRRFAAFVLCICHSMASIQIGKFVCLKTWHCVLIASRDVSCLIPYKYRIDEIENSSKQHTLSTRSSRLIWTVITKLVESFLKRAFFLLNFKSNVWALETDINTFIIISMCWCAWNSCSEFYTFHTHVLISSLLTICYSFFFHGFFTHSFHIKKSKNKKKWPFWFVQCTTSTRSL